jgi:hypothetical protein
MYSIDRDSVIVLEDIPKPSVGAPTPLVIADGQTVLVGFNMGPRDPVFSDPAIRIVDPEKTVDPVAVVAFPRYCAMMFGPPGDETLDGHPLSSRGLTPHDAFEVEDSSWIRALARMDSVNPRHRPGHFAKLRHFILIFHDSTFECVAPGYEITRHPGPLGPVVDWMRAQLRRS